MSELNDRITAAAPELLEFLKAFLILEELIEERNPGNPFNTLAQEGQEIITKILSFPS